MFTEIPIFLNYADEIKYPRNLFFEPVGDLYRDYVSLLINAEGSIVDATGKTITNGGSTVLSNIYKPYGKSSIYFNGSTNYLTLADSTQWELDANDFTLECWVYPISSSPADYQGILSHEDQNATATYGWLLITDNLDSDKLRITLRDSGGTSYGVTGNPLVAGKWQHIAVTRKKNKVRVFQDGILTGEDDISIAVNTNSELLRIGCLSSNSTNWAYFNGYIKDIRITNSFARYISSFKPERKLLTYIKDSVDSSLKNHFPKYRRVGLAAIPKDKFRTLDTDIYYNKLILWLPLDGNIKDYSKKKVSVTANQTTLVNNNSSANYKRRPNNNYGLYFDGADDRLTGTIEALGTNDFTIETFFVPHAAASQSYGRLLQLGSNSTNGGLWLVRGSTSNPMYLFVQGYNGGYFNLVDTSATLSESKPWSHIVLTRKAGFCNLYVDGRRYPGNTGYESYNITQTTFYIGANQSLTEEIAGTIAGFKIYKGIAKYISRFEVDWDQPIRA